MHRVVKEIIGSSRGGFNRVIVRIHHNIVLQVDDIRASLNLALTKKPRDFETADIPDWAEKVFEPLFFNVGNRCITHMVESYWRIVKLDFSLECKDYWERQCQGLPCVHEIANALVNRTPITPADVHPFWRELIWEDSSTSGDISLRAKEVTHRRLRDMWSQFTTGLLKQSTAYQIGELYHDLQNPEQATYMEQTSALVKTKGRPPGARNKNKIAARDKSLFEHREKEAREAAKQKAKDKKKGKEEEKQGKTRGRPKKADCARDADEIGHEELPSQPQAEEEDERLIHLGVDFGVNNVDR